MAADEMTGCLPDVWQFCEPRPADDYTNLMCPSVAYRRPVKTMANQLVQVLQMQKLFDEPADCIPLHFVLLGPLSKVTFQNCDLVVPR